MDRFDRGLAWCLSVFAVFAMGVMLVRFWAGSSWGSRFLMIFAGITMVRLIWSDAFGWIKR